MQSRSKHEARLREFPLLRRMLLGFALAASMTVASCHKPPGTATLKEEHAPEPRQVYTGIGIVVGLNGTGDGDDFEPLKIASRSGLRGRRLEARDFANMAIVVVVGKVRATASVGEHVDDVTVTAMGPASSLDGGILLETRLDAFDDEQKMIVTGGNLRATQGTSRGYSWRVETPGVVARRPPS